MTGSMTSGIPPRTLASPCGKSPSNSQPASNTGRPMPPNSCALWAGASGTGHAASAYLLYQIADSKGRSEDAVAYNGLVQTWHDIARLASASHRPTQETLQIT